MGRYDDSAIRVEKLPRLEHMPNEKSLRIHMCALTKLCVGVKVCARDGGTNIVSVLQKFRAGRKTIVLVFHRTTFSVALCWHIIFCQMNEKAFGALEVPARNDLFSPVFAPIWRIIVGGWVVFGGVACSRKQTLAVWVECWMCLCFWMHFVWRSCAGVLKSHA